TAIGSSRLPIGSVEQIVCERMAAVDLRDKLAVLDQLAADALVIERLLGDVRSVSAAGVSKEQPTWRNLTVHFAGAGALVARWTLAPLRDVAGMRVTLVDSAETVSLWLPDEPDATEHSVPDLGVHLPNAAFDAVQAVSDDEFLEQV